MKNRKMYLHIPLFLATALFFPTLVSGLNAGPKCRQAGTRLAGDEGGLGSGNRWMDVTNQVRMLLSGNGMVKVEAGWTLGKGD